MIVYLWVEPANSPPGYHTEPRWQAVIPDHPQVNATAATQTEVESLIRSAWSQHHPNVPLEFADRPAEWVHPGELREAAHEPDVFVYNPDTGVLDEVPFYVKAPARPS